MLEAQIADQPGQHADACLFASLPRSRRVRAARLLAKIGDCRARVPGPESPSAGSQPGGELPRLLAAFQAVVRAAM